MTDSMRQRRSSVNPARSIIRVISSGGILRSVLVSGAATTLAVLLGVPVGYLIARRMFPGRTVLLGFINTGMGMPPVVVGLVVWLLLVRSGALGDLGLIYTPYAMAQAAVSAR